MAIDQAHEQNNASVKGDGGAVGLTENPAALRRWMVSDPEMAIVIGEFEAVTKKAQSTDCRHQEERKHIQKLFQRDVQNLTNTINEMRNPFTDNSSHLVVLDNKDIADPVVIETIRKIEEPGQEQHKKFMSRSKPLTDPIKKNSLSVSQPSNQKENQVATAAGLHKDGLFSLFTIVRSVTSM